MEDIKKALMDSQIRCNECDKNFINERALKMHNYKKHTGENMNEIKEEPFERICSEEVKEPELIDAGLFTLENNCIKKLDTSEEVILKFDKNSKLLKSLDKIDKLINLKPLLLEMIKEIDEIEIIKPELETLIKEINGK